MRHLALSFALVLSALATPALADSPITGISQATAAVSNSCTIVSADDIAFGAYAPISGLDALASGQLALRCTKGTAYTVIPTNGGSALRGPGGSLNYALYIDSAMTKAWAPAGFTGTLPFDFSQKLNGDSSQRATIGFTTRPLTASQFAANPAYANQPYAVVNINGTYSYYVGYVSQLFSSSDITAYRSAHPGSSTSGVDAVYVGGGPLPSLNTSTLILPAGTPSSGTVYQVGTGYTGGFSLSGTTSTGVAAQILPYYGKVPAGQDMTPGLYIDTVVFTVSF